MPNASFIQVISDNAVLYPNKPAAVHNGKAISYGELLARARRLATEIVAVNKAKRPVLLVLPNSIQRLESILGCYLAAVCVVTDVRNNTTLALKNFQPGLLIGSEATRSQLPTEALAASNTAAWFIDCSNDDAIVRADAGASDLALDLNIATDAPALGIHTSGTTGEPKCAIHSYNSLTLLTRELVNRLSYDATDRSLVALQMLSAFSLTSQVLPALVAGATLVIHDSFDANKVVEAIRNDGITRLYLYGHSYQELCTVANPPRVNSLRSCVAGAEPCAATTNFNFEKIYGVDVTQSMGMVETLAHSLNLSKDARKRGSAGQPLCGARVFILDDEGHVLPNGEPGEIAVDSPLMMTHYNGKESPSMGTVFRTGDLGYIDEDGFLWFVARKAAGQDLVLLKYIQKLNNAIFGIEGVKEAFVMNPEGSKVVVFVSVQTAGEQARVRKEIEAISDNRTEMEIKFLDRLPILPIGKLDLTTLKAMAQ